MTERDKFIYEVLFDNAFLTKKGDEFQQFFSKIMNLLYPSVFIPTCLWGKLGDKKCDGYLLNDEIVYQVYAPKEVERTKTEAKMRDDFSGALKKWGKQMKSWVFVDNSIGGVPPFVISLLEEFKKENPSIEFKHLGYVELKQLLLNESDSIIEQVLGTIPIEKGLSKSSIISSEYWEVVRALYELMMINQYDWWNEHAMRGLLFYQLVDHKLDLFDLKMGFVWPETDTEFERLIKDLIDRFGIYIDVFMEHSILRADSFWVEDKFYKRIPYNPNYHEDLELYNKWEKRWFHSLNNFVFVLNEFIQYINTHYSVDIIALKRKKALIDSMGIYSAEPRFTEQHFFPTRLLEIE